ncbi:MAG: tRNA lysidine(34) synthetase TilS [Clostridia bacterium]|nr:tRNA lysidine(34) synthetase TilS [Clostridia bacterium]
MTTVDKFLDTIKKYSMLRPGDDVLVGFSGGADSTCLLSLLYENRSVLGISVRAAHINHGLRGQEAERDELFAKSFCEERGIPFFVLHADVASSAREKGISEELAGREVRYGFFKSLSPDKIATAHTLSDVCETLLMNISRGASLKGLCSIPPVRGNVIRPLIECTRAETEYYCSDNGIDFVVDSTNVENDHTRNKIRNRVLPEIKKIYPAFESAALRCINSARLENDYIEKTVVELYDKLCDGASLDVSGFSELHEAARLRLIAKFISQNVKSDFETKHLMLIDANIFVKGFSLSLPGGQTVRTDSKKLFFVSEEKNSDAVFQETVLKKEDLRGSFCFNGYPVFFTQTASEGHFQRNAADFDKIDGTVVIRPRKEGDRISLAGRKCTKTLKKLFCELKIPVEERSGIPVIADKNGIIYVPFAGVDASRAVTDKTRQILIIDTESKNEQ